MPSPKPVVPPPEVPTPAVRPAPQVPPAASNPSRASESRPEVAARPAAVSASPPAASQAKPAAETGSNLPPPSAAEVQKAWARMVADFHDLVGSYAEAAESVAFSMPNRLVASFPKKYNIAKANCERQAARIADAMSQNLGRSVRLECVLLEDRGGSEAKKEVPRGPTQHEKMREKTQQPFVRQALELFDARPIRLEEDKDAS